jgi:predicted Na+-dependent transporter
VKFLYRLDTLVGKQILLFTLLCAFLAVAFPDVFSPLSRLTPCLFAFMTFSSTLGAGFRELRDALAHPLPILTALLLLHVAVPVLALAAGRLLFPQDPFFVTGMVLEYAVPTGVASLMWVSMYRGNVTLSLSIVLTDTLLAPFVIPATLHLLCGSAVELDVSGMMRDLLFMVALPALCAMLVYQFFGRERSTGVKSRLSPFAKLCLLTILLANSSGVASQIRNMSGILWLVTGAVFALSVLGFFLGYLASRLLCLDRPSALSMTLNTGMRNINAGAVLASRYFPPEVLFPVVISSLFLQVLVSLVVKLLWAADKTAAGGLRQTPGS